MADLTKGAAYWRGEVVALGDAGLPLQAKWSLPEGAELGELRYPTPVAFEGAGLINYVYKDTHAILTTLSVPASNRGVLRITGELRWLRYYETLDPLQPAMAPGTHIGAAHIRNDLVLVADLINDRLFHFVFRETDVESQM